MWGRSLPTRSRRYGNARGGAGAPAGPKVPANVTDGARRSRTVGGPFPTNAVPLGTFASCREKAPEVTLRCVLSDEGLEVLTEEESLRLLGTGELGRVGVTVGALPAIFPVNYRVVGEAIVFRTAPGTKLSAAADGAVVAFETDHYDTVDRTGWSVLVVGRSEVVHDLDMAFKVLDAGLEPFAPGVRTAIVRIAPEFVSGRRIVREPDAVHVAGPTSPSALAALQGRRVSVARADRSCIDGAVLQAVTTSALWLYFDGMEVSVPMRDVLDVWEAGP